MTKFRLKKDFIKFCVVGTIGFLVEAAIIQIVKWIWIDFLLYVRFVSFPTALFVTWILNRVFVFESNNSKVKEVVKYVVVQVLGALLNISVYSIFIIYSLFFFNYPVLALALGSIVALFWNYIFSKIWVFI